MIVDTTTLAVVVNPESASDQAEALAEQLRSAGVEAHWSETTPDDPGRGQASDAIAAGASLIVACGGDGTIRACIEAAAGTHASVGIIPAGTGNLLARNLGVPLDTKDAFDVIRTGEHRRIDLGFANGEAFAVMAGVGLDARIMHDTDRDAKRRFGVAAYVVTALRHIHDRRFLGSLDVDGHQRWAGPASAILVGNHGEIQGGLALFPDASAQDGNLDVLVSSADGIVDWLRTAWGVLRKDPTAGPIARFSGTRLEVRTTTPVPYEIDGEERPPSTEIDFRLAPGAVSVVIPQENDR